MHKPSMLYISKNYRWDKLKKLKMYYKYNPFVYEDITVPTYPVYKLEPGELFDSSRLGLYMSSVG